MSERGLRTGRIVSSVAATLMALACGTNYVYSAWAPQFADKLKLSATESNLIGTAGNLGMYSVGIPVGILVDSKGPRIAVIMGAILLALGYFPLHQAYDSASGSVPLLCLYSFFTGVGGCSAFAASIKASALNWPHHRGTATAFPLAAFGLSAFFFSSISTVFAPGDVGDFLMLLASGTFGLVFISFFFLRVYPHTAYTALGVVNDELGSESNRLHRTKSEDSSKRSRRSPLIEPGDEESETSSLVSRASSSESNRGMESDENAVDKDHSHPDIRGWKMVPTAEFWQLFLLMGILTGIGLMTINNIGNDATALWRHYDDSATPQFILQQQQLHVSILSVCSFLGRLLSGVGSDFLVKKLHASRYWCLNIASVIFFIAQICALEIENPKPSHLGFVSGLTGLAYGFLFGCYPSLVAEAFGVHGLSQNWGCMTLAPVISGNIFNLFYGMVYDGHSTVLPSGERQCPDGLACYRSAYWMTFGACILGWCITLWSIHHAHVKSRREKERELEGREA